MFILEGGWVVEAPHLVAGSHIFHCPACDPVQVCVISVITSVVLFALPLGGRCHACDSGNTEHCVKSELQGRVQSSSLQEDPATRFSGLVQILCYCPNAMSCTVRK